MENTQDVTWYITVYSMGLIKRYNFKTDKERDYVYEFLLDRILRNQSTQINDCKRKEIMFFPSTLTVAKGEEPINPIELEELELDTFFHKREELVLTAMGMRG